MFVEPFFPLTQRNFVRGLAEVGATVIGIGEYPTEALDEQLRSWMTHYHQVPSVVDVGVMTDAVKWIPVIPVDGIADSREESFRLSGSEVNGKYVIIRAVDGQYNVVTGSVK